MRVALLATCTVDLLEPDVGVAVVRVLRAAGCQVSCPSGQTCCGQPAWNAGFADEAAKVARTTLDALEAEQADAVVVPAGSCATMVRIFWPELFEITGDHAAADRARRLGTKTREFCEFVADRELPPLAVDRSRTVAYHHSCHALRELRVEHQPLDLLDSVDGVTRVEWAASQRCCGFGGLFSFKLPETSVAIADDKLASLAEAGADCVVSADSSCLLHLRSRAAHEGRPITTRHVAQVLAEALDARGAR